MHRLHDFKFTCQEGFHKCKLKYHQSRVSFSDLLEMSPGVILDTVSELILKSIRLESEIEQNRLSK